MRVATDVETTRTNDANVAPSSDGSKETTTAKYASSIVRLLAEPGLAGVEDSPGISDASHP